MDYKMKSYFLLIILWLLLQPLTTQCRDTSQEYHQRLKTHFGLVNKSRVLQDILAQYSKEEASSLLSSSTISAISFGASFFIAEPIMRLFPALILIAWNFDNKSNIRHEISKKIKKESIEIQALLQNKDQLIHFPEIIAHTNPDHESMVALISDNEQTNIDRFIPGCGIRHRIKKLKDMHPSFNNELQEIWIKITQECQARFDALNNK